MKVGRILIAVVTGVVLSSCATVEWTRPDPDHDPSALSAAFERDKGACTLQAQEVAGPTGDAPAGRSTGSAESWTSLYKRAFDSCMVRKGWTKTD